MNHATKVTALLLRLTLGTMFFATGFVKVLDPLWSAAGYLKHAQTFAAFYGWLGSAQNAGWVSSLNAWGLTLIGLSLLVGALVRWSSVCGAAMMLLYYFPILTFPYVGRGTFLFDEHIIFSLVFVLLFTVRAGEYFGLDSLLKKTALKRVV